MNILFQILSSVIMFVLLVVPNAPFRVRYTLAACILLALYRWREWLGHAVLRWQAWLVGYAVFMGVMVMILYGDGTTKTIFTPVADLVLAAIAVMAFRGRSRTTLLSFASLWSLIQLLALIEEFRHGRLTSRLPFPIVPSGSGEQSDYTNVEETRFGGFTAESSVVGGMAAVFGVFALMVLTAPGQSNLRNPWRRFDTLMAWFIFISAAAINVLAETKAGAFIFAAFGVAYLVGDVVSGGLLKARRVLGVGAAMAVIAGLGLFAMRFNAMHDFMDYATDELNRAEDLLQFGETESVETSGLGTRFEYFKLTAFGLPFHPLGVGSNSGYIYAKPVLHMLSPTEEMAEAFSKSRYGVQTPFCLVVVWTGLVGIVLFWFMLRAASRRMRGGPSSTAFVWTVTGLAPYFVFVVTIGMIPYLAILIFLVEAARSCYDHAAPESSLVPEAQRSGKSSTSRRRKMENGTAPRRGEEAASVRSREVRSAERRRRFSKRSQFRKEEEPGKLDQSDE